MSAKFVIQIYFGDKKGEEKAIDRTGCGLDNRNEFVPFFGSQIGFSARLFVVFGDTSTKIVLLSG